MSNKSKRLNVFFLINYKCILWTIILFTLFIINPLIITIHAEESYTLSGFVRNSETGEDLIGVSIYVEGKKIGSRTNVYGFYSLTLPSGKYKLKYRYIGYKTTILDIELKNNIKKNMDLVEESVQTDEIIVTAKRGDENVSSAEMGVSQITPAEVKSLPIIFGEQDILKSIQLMPGISATSEANSGFFVRGGGPDQNLILLDEATVYNPSHLMGFFSVFNSDAIKDVKVIKGSAPAEYGGRLSSILDIRMNEGNLKEYDVKGGIGLISSRLSVEGPIVKDKGSFIISGRRTYFDLFLALSSNENAANSKIYFYDLNMKANYKLGEDDRVFLSGYYGRDVANLMDQLGFDWGNFTTTLRWNHLFSDKLFLNSSLIYSKYDYVVNFDNGENLVDIRSSIMDYNLKEDFQYFLNSTNMIKFGFNGIYHTFIPGEITNTDSISTTVSNIGEKYAFENAVYISHELEISEYFKINYGVRYSGFSLLGPGTIYTYDKDGDVSDVSDFSNNELIKYYGGFEPRLLMTFLLSGENSIKAGYARNRQYMHLLSNTTSTTPLDIWQPTTNNVEPGIADQFSIGYFQNFDNNNYEASVEVYYKDLQNQIDYRNGADLLLNDKVEAELVYGRGWAYGLELFFKKNVGDFTGWIGYTWAISERQFDDIDNGEPYPAKYDRTHDVSVVATYTPNEKWTISATWIYNTGNAVTFPSGKYEIGGKTINLFTERNGYRMPDYHRFDIGVTYTFKKSGSYESSLNFSVYNAYGQKNPYMISFQQNENDPTKTEAVKTYLFTYIPSITYNFNF